MVRDFLRDASVALIVAAVLHGVWETAHLPLYTGYGALSGSIPIVLYAAAGDVIYTFLVVAMFAFYKRDGRWMRRAGRAEYAALAAVGLGIAILVEYKAMLLHLWEYTPAMPTLFGLGVSPLLQMIILLPLSVFIAQQLINKAGLV